MSQETRLQCGSFLFYQIEVIGPSNALLEVIATKSLVIFAVSCKLDSHHRKL